MTTRPLPPCPPDALPELDASPAPPPPPPAKPPPPPAFHLLEPRVPLEPPGAPFGLPPSVAWY